MSDHRDISANDGRDGVGGSLTPLELDRVSTAFFDDAAGAFERLRRAKLKGHERQVGHDHRSRRSPDNAANMVNDLIERDR